ncbi:MAG: DNA translocase FtsK 4TM domain-containing protein [Lautropia sp.]|nr:DNA translocase FtsK 4TM domain-containing protein [Lautropia sp.]
MARSAAHAPVAEHWASRHIGLSQRAIRLLREARWIGLCFLALFLLLILISYDPRDPGWSHAVLVRQTSNLGGKVGAWFADLMLYLFGLSAYLFSFFLILRVLVSYRRLHRQNRQMALPADARAGKDARDETPPVVNRFAWERWIGFVLLLVGACAIEGSRLYNLGADLPLAPGGLLGALVADPVHEMLGNVGGTMALLLLIAIGFSLATGMSWMSVFERTGACLEAIVLWVKDRLAAHADVRAGARAAQKRGSLLDAHQRPPIDIDGDSPIEPLIRPAPRLPAAEPVIRAVTEPVIAAAAGLGRAVSGAVQSGVSSLSGGGGAVARHIEPTLAGSQGAAAESGPLNQMRTVARATPVYRELGEDSPLPPLELLDAPPDTVETMSPETLEYTSRLIEKKLADFGINATVVSAYPGPVITRYEIEPATGVKGAQIVNLAKDLARALSVISLRVVETIPGKNLMGLELPNPRRQGVRLSEIIGSKTYADSKSMVTVALGKDIAGNPVVADLARMPHLLVAGTTGSGKSVGINAMLISILYKADPSQVRMIMIDPKMLEMSVYEGIPHLLAPVVTDMRQAGHALNWCVGEMERRYKLMSKLGVRNLAGYNAKIAEAEAREELIPNPFSLTPDAPEPLQKLPVIVVVIDELADLMMVVGKKIEELIARLAQKARAAGIHLILATQRPSVDVITGLIKANIPSRIAFQVSSKIDSRTILDQMGAETLLGQGDMLFLPAGTNLPQRVHGAYVADDEVHKVVAAWKDVGGEPDYIEGILEGGVPEEASTGSAVGFGGLSSTLAEAGMDGESDPMYDQAVAIVLQHRRASISLVQRHLRIGYNRAARLLEQMERSGLVSAMGGNGNRDILVPASGGAREED